MGKKKHTTHEQTALGGAFALMAALVLGACQFEVSHNGALDGFWHLTRIDTLATGGEADLSQQRLFWSFQGKILQIDDKDKRHPGIYMRFDHTTEDKLLLSEPYLNNRAIGDKKVEDTAPLAPYGINALQESFTVETLKGNRMTLANQTLRLSFTKF